VTMRHEHKYYAVPWKRAIETRLKNGNRIRVYRLNDDGFALEFYRALDCKVTKLQLSEQAGLALMDGIEKISRC
jgi:hypothetical protein